MAESEAPKRSKENAAAAASAAASSQNQAASSGVVADNNERSSDSLKEQLSTTEKLISLNEQLVNTGRENLSFLKLGLGVSEKINKIKEIEQQRDMANKSLADRINKLKESGSEEDQRTLALLEAQQKEAEALNNDFRRQAASIKIRIALEEAFNTAALAVYETEDKIASAFAKGVAELLKQRTIVGFIQTGLKTLLDLALAVDDAIVKQNKELGFSRIANKQISDLSTEIYENYVAFGVTLEDVLKSTTALTKTFGQSFTLTSGIADDLALFESRLGVSAESSATFLDNLGAVAGDVKSSSTDSILFAKQISEAAGVPLNDLMKEAAESSGELATFSGQSGTNILKAAANAKLLGVSLNSFVGASSKSLNFQSSIQAELKASVLLGKNLNLQALRRASFNKDIVGVEREVLNITKRVGDLRKLDPIQMNALAEATGLTAEELLKIQNRQVLSKNTLQKVNAIEKQTLEMKKASAEQDAISAANLNQVRLLGTRIAGTLTKMIMPLIPAITRFMGGLGNFFEANAPQIQAVANAFVDKIAPAAQTVSKALNVGGSGPMFAMITGLDNEGKIKPWVKWAAVIAGAVLSLKALVGTMKTATSVVKSVVVDPIKDIIGAGKTAIGYGKSAINIFKGYKKGGIKGAIGAVMGEKKEEDKCCIGISGAASSISTVADTMVKGQLGKQIGLYIARFLPTALVGPLSTAFISAGSILGTTMSGILAGGAAAIAGAAASVAAVGYGGYKLGGYLEEEYGAGTKMLENSAIYKLSTRNRDKELEEQKKQIDTAEKTLMEKKARKQLGFATKGELTTEQQAAINALVDKFGTQLANLPKQTVQFEYSRFQQNSAVAASRGNTNQVSVMPQIN